MSERELSVYDLDIKKVHVLGNAYDVKETRALNSVYELEFTIPADEADMAFLIPYHYVRYGDDGELYRLTQSKKVSSDASTVTYYCEHVIATLSDDVMFGRYGGGNLGEYTDAVIRTVLGFQTVKNGHRNWEPGECDLSGQFEYAWENENLLAALWSIPKCFVTPYRFSFDTTSYPWRLSVKTIDTDGEPQFYLRAESNILQSRNEASSLDICTRLYGLGEGEGVNQLTIRAVNGGLPYIQSSAEKVAKYGLVSRIFVDRSFQSAETLKARMQTLLAELENPQYSRTFDIADLYDLTEYDLNKAEVGRVAMLADDQTKTFITKTVKNWSVPGDMQVELSTKSTDIAGSIADLADRQRIEQVYSQGATQMYAWNFAGDASSTKGLVGYIYFPADLKYLNAVKMKIKLGKFRYYSQATKSGGGQTSSSSIDTTGNAKSNTGLNGKIDQSFSSGNSLKTSDSSEMTTTESKADTIHTSGMQAGTVGEGYTYAFGRTETAGHPTICDDTKNVTENDNNDDAFTKLTQVSGSGSIEATSIEMLYEPEYVGNSNYYTYKKAISFSSKLGITIDSETNGYHRHYMPHTHKVLRLHQHYHVFNPFHYHDMWMDGHAHGMSHFHTIPIRVDDHYHDMAHYHTIKAHDHEIENDVFEADSSPSTADIYVKGTFRKTINNNSDLDKLDITEFLVENGAVPRDEWIEIEVRPASLAYVQMFGTTIAFIQSYTGGNY